MRSRIDWKYALSLDLTDAGFDSSVLCEFRQRLLDHQADGLLLDTLLTHFRTLGLLKIRGQQRTDSTYVLTAVRTLNRLACVNETLRAALNSVATVAPDWLLPQVPLDWVDRYGPRTDGYRLPKTLAARQALAETIGMDGFTLLRAVYDLAAPPWLRELPAVQTLRQIWLQQYYAPTNTVRWRTSEDIPPAAQMTNSPYDPDARYGIKRETQWTGYKVHVTETCDANAPHLITHVETTPATTLDYEVTSTIHAALAMHDRVPAQHLVNTGYMDADNVLASRHHAIDLLGPMHGDQSWQAHTPGALDISHFTIDWNTHRVTCPAGCVARKWVPGHTRHGAPIIQVKFRKKQV